MQTAVEFLEQQIGSKIADANIRISAPKFYELINQAKEMEREVNAIDNRIESFIDEFKSKIAPTMGVLIELDRLKDKYTNKEIVWNQQ